MITKEDELKAWHKFGLLGLALLLLVLQFIPIVAAGSWAYMALTLAVARREGVYAAPEDGMVARVEKSWIDVHPTSFSEL